MGLDIHARKMTEEEQVVMVVVVVVIIIDKDNVLVIKMVITDRTAV
jgi:hypothetical protein